MELLEYKELYFLQDKVLDVVFTTEREFYLTGGTCLNRFYVEKRYSNDLDFFANNSNRFHFAVKNIYDSLSTEFSVQREIDSKDFLRLRVENFLQVDFVNDTAYYYKEPRILKNNWILDNVENILANKVTAIIGRDNPKDIFDLYLIAKHYSFSWKEILEVAQKKSHFSKTDLVVRLQTFPRALLDSLHLTDPLFLTGLPGEFAALIGEIIEDANHVRII